MKLSELWLRYKLKTSLENLMEKMGITVLVKRKSGLTKIIIDGREMEKYDCSDRAKETRQEIIDFLGTGDLIHVSIKKEDGVNLFTVGADKGMTYKKEMLFFHQLNRFFIDRQDYWWAYSLENYFSQFETNAAQIKVSVIKE